MRRLTTMNWAPRVAGSIDHSALVSDADQYKEDVAVTLLDCALRQGTRIPNRLYRRPRRHALSAFAALKSDEPADLEEERRLCYVAITRAEKYLYVTHAMKRRVYGEELASEPSQFLNGDAPRK